MIKIKNIYYMLAYAYQNLNEAGYKSVQTEEFTNLHDLLSAILIRGVTNQVKRGLDRDYLSQTEKTSSLRGKIDITNSIKQNTMLSKSMVCQYDHFSENILLNQILKTTMQLFIRYGDIKKENRKELKRLMQFFVNVETLGLHAINWSSIKFHRNNINYKMLINICWLVINGLIMTTEDGECKMKQYLDDQQMHRLYEKFLLGYFKKEYPQYKASASYIEWNVDNEFVDFLPVMKSDITLTNGPKTLIIDAKYYGRTLQFNSMFDSKSIISGNLYQIFTYVKNKDRSGSGNVSGLLLYAKTDEDLTPDYDYQIGGNHISVRTLDLGAEWSEIERQLATIASLIENNV